MSAEGGAGPARTLEDILREAGMQAAGRGGRRRRAEDTGPVPVPPLAEPAAEPAGEPIPATAARAGLGWLLSAAELVGAAVLGVLIWYAFSLLWELYPYVAALAAPFVLTGLVVGGRLVRRRSGRRLGLSTLIALLLVGTLLAVLPAAAVLSGT